MVSCLPQQGQRLLATPGRIVEPAGLTIDDRDGAEGPGVTPVVAGFPEQQCRLIEVATCLLVALLLKQHRTSALQHRRLPVRILRLPAGLKGDVHALPPVGKISPGLEKVGRRDREAPGQPGVARLGGLPYRRDQPGPLGLEPRERIVAYLVRLWSGPRPARRGVCAEYRRIVIAEAATDGVAGEGQQGAERALQRRRLLCGGF